MGPGMLNKSVYPSGSARATDMAPIVPLAPPGRFSTRTVWPSDDDSRSARVRTTISLGPPGGPSEIVVRTLAERLSSSLGQTVLVENRPGGPGTTNLISRVG